MAIEKLNARKVETNKIPGMLGDGGGLYLVTSPAGSKSWTFIFRYHGKRKEMGLGSFPQVSLAEARDLADEARKVIARGENPIEIRRGALEAKRLATERAKTFGKYATDAVKVLTAELRSDKHRKQWQSTLKEYAGPIWDTGIAEIKPVDIVSCLAPIWTSKPETARRVRQRIEAVMSHAIASGAYNGLNPARLKDNLENLLPRRNSAKRVNHHRALPYEKVAELLQELRRRSGAGTLAFELLILTACRSGEIRLLKWCEVDLKDKLLRLPGDRTKSGQGFVVPLSDAAVEVLEAARERSTDLSPDAYVFAGQRAGRPLSVMIFEMALRKMEVDATPHGMRSSFRDWSHDRTRFKREFVEQCLGHSIGNQTERAYLRSDALVERRKIMQAWANYIAPRAGNVVALPTKKAKA